MYRLDKALLKDRETKIQVVLERITYFSTEGHRRVVDPDKLAAFLVDIFENQDDTK